MKKVLSLGVILILLGMGIIPSTGTIVEESTTSFDGKTLYVGGDGPENYSKIKDAIDNASDGDTVFVYDNSSPYYENIIVNKSIDLIGEDKFTTIIDANMCGNCIDIYADGITASGFTIQNADYMGIEIHSNNNIITDNIITNNDWFGVLIYGNYNNISNNVISNRWMGITCELSKNTIMRNKIINNKIGIHLGGSSTVIFNNNISGNNLGIDCSASNISIIQNNFLNNRINAVFYRSIFGEIRSKILYEIIKGINKIFPNLWPYYDTYFEPLRKNTWDGNYWNGTRTIPKPIFGCLRISGFSIYVENIPFPINFVNFDWHPAKEPYDIEV